MPLHACSVHEKSSKDLKSTHGSFYEVPFLEYTSEQSFNCVSSELELISHIVGAITKTTYESYGEASGKEFDSIPWWRCRSQLFARRLAAVSSRLLAEGSRGIHFRMHIEPLVFQRLSLNSDCDRCKMEIWRSQFQHFEPHNEEAFSQSGAPVSPCSCSSPQVVQETTANCTLRSHVSDMVHPELKYPSENQQTSLKSSRVFGISKTKEISDLLNAAKESIAPICLHYQSRIPLISPFLVSHATSSDDSCTMRCSVARCHLHSRTLLMLQESLREMPGVGDRDQEGSLVWSFAYDGSFWRVYGYCANKAYSKLPTYCSVPLWKGDITNLNHALQLLLIVDYIAGWVEGKHYPSVLSLLRQIAQPQPLTNAKAQRKACLNTIQEELPPSRTDTRSGILGLPTAKSVFSFSIPSEAKNPENGKRSIAESWTQTLASTSRSPSGSHVRINPTSDGDPNNTGITLDKMFLDEAGAPSDQPNDTNNFTKHDSAFGVVRTSQRTRFEVHGICLTAKNLIDVLTSVGDHAQQSIFVRDVLRYLANTPYKALDMKEFRQLEDVWLGRDPMNHDDFDDEGTVLFKHSFEYGIGHDWYPFRRTVYLATTNACYLMLKLRASDVHLLYTPYTCNAGSRLTLISESKDLNDATPSQTMAASTARITLPGLKQTMDAETNSAEALRLMSLVGESPSECTPSSPWRLQSSLKNRLTFASGSKRLERIKIFGSKLSAAPTSTVVIGVHRTKPPTSKLSYELCNMLLSLPHNTYTKENLNRDLEMALKNDTVYYTDLGYRTHSGNQHKLKRAYSVSTVLHEGISFADLIQAWIGHLGNAVPLTETSGRKQLLAQLRADKTERRFTIFATGKDVKSCCMICGQRLHHETGDILLASGKDLNPADIQVCKNLLQCLTRAQPDGKPLEDILG